MFQLYFVKEHNDLVLKPKNPFPALELDTSLAIQEPPGMEELWVGLLLRETEWFRGS